MKASLATLVVALAFSFIHSVSASADNASVIRAVFGQYGSQAVAVARCESGLSTGALNGPWPPSRYRETYAGAFQFGSFARSRYGFGWDIWTQARAAYAYFKAAGYSWSPWQCKPY